MQQLQLMLTMHDALSMAVCVRCKVRQRSAEDRLREERLTFKLDDDMTKRLAEVESCYRREIMEKDWKRILKEMVKDVRFPCSDWWNEYLHCVVSR